MVLRTGAARGQTQKKGDDMTSKRAATMVGMAALMMQILVFQGCSSSGTTPAPGGTGGTTAAGTGNTTGATGGVTGAGGAGGELPLCPAGLDNHAACTTGDPCFKTCGPTASGRKTCTCTGVEWNCAVCGYAPGMSYSCYKLPVPVPACTTTDPSGIPKNGDPCDFEPCHPCGSTTSGAFGYRDGSNIMKIGYCVCSAAGGTGKLSCASTQEWPPQL
jgi:hypothetical protein